MMARQEKLAGIEYFGVAGASRECQDGVMRLLQYGDFIKQTRIISCSNTHCLLLTNETGDLVAIKSGFSSGYGGEGPRRFSYALAFLKAHGSEIDECEVDDAIIDRLDRSALTISDIEKIKDAKPIRPSRWPDYVHNKHYENERDGTLWGEFPPVIPFAIIDSRIIDLALAFWKNPDDNLLKGYRRLEDIVRERTGLSGHGAQLFSKAFSRDAAPLHWEGLEEAESVGRTNLFTGAFMAHRNPRAHRELKGDSDKQLTEFLVLNHLYHLEKEARPTPKSAQSGTGSSTDENTEAARRPRSAAGKRR